MPWREECRPMDREMLILQPQRLQLIDQQIAQLDAVIAMAMKPHQDADPSGRETRLGVDSALQIIAK